MFREPTTIEQDSRSTDKAVRPDRQRSLRPLSRLAPFLSPYRWPIAGALAALTVSAVTVLGLGQGLRILVDQGFSKGSSALMDQALLVLLGVIALLALATYARFYLVSWLGERISADLRSAVYRHILTQAPSYFETTPTGEILSRLTTDTTLVQVVIGSAASIALRNLLLLIGGIVMLLITSAKLTGLVLLVVPVVVVPIVVFGRKVRTLARENQARIAEVGVQVDESLAAIRTVFAHGQEGREAQRFGERVEAAFDSAVDRIRARALMTALVILLVFGAVGVVLWLGGHDVLAGRISAGDLSAFVLYAALVAGSTGAISEVVSDLQRAAGATERLFELLAAVPQIAAPANPIALPEPARGAVSFEGVRFHYPSRPQTAALADFSLTAAPGETIALVGPSGAGKTTVFQLLLRFYDPAAGVIRLDGVDIRAADPAAVRRRIGLVPQEPVIFSTTARENIRYGCPEADDAAVRAAAQAAHALEFIEPLPNGFDTFLGEKGIRLSGGQRQRIAIARAILRNPPVLLLDEATSSLDAESERMIQDALSELLKNRTTLIIAHRLATVQNADRIVVIDQGRVVATGTHAELLRAGGLYGRLAALQFDLTEAV